MKGLINIALAVLIGLSIGVLSVIYLHNEKINAPETRIEALENPHNDSLYWE